MCNDFILYGRYKQNCESWWNCVTWLDNLDANIIWSKTIKSALRIEQGLQLVAHKIGSKFKETLCPNSYTDVRNLTCKCVLQSIHRNHDS